jgi:hypothetical protein
VGLPGSTLRAIRPISVQRCANPDAHIEDAFVSSLAFRPRRETWPDRPAVWAA